MMMFEKFFKSSEDQAVAAWINYLNQVRLDRLFQGLQEQDLNLGEALNTLNSTLKQVNDVIIERNRGGINGMHGFIAEVAECGIENARNLVQGKAKTCFWINDNGPTDLVRNGIEIQQKFYNDGRNLSLQAIKQHLEKYPNYLKGNRKYQIPSDQYEKIKYLLSISKEQANKMPTKNGEFSLKQWKAVHNFFEEGKVKLEDIEPSKLEHKDVQKNQIGKTIETEKKSIRNTDKTIREEIYNKSKPTLKEGAQAAASAAVIEGGYTFVNAIIKKKKSGKAIKEFTNDDWMEIAQESGVGTLKGGTRGVTIYALTNYTATPAAVANALCTASFGIANEANKYRNGEISQEEFLWNAELLSVEVSVSALSSAIGQVVIPIPVVGAVIGNVAGTFLYQMAKDNLNKKEQRIIKQYLKELQDYNAFLDKKLQNYIRELDVQMKEYYKLLEMAFSPDYEMAFQGAINLARYLGVPEEEILKNEKDIDVYFQE